jgi:cytochrome c peroxidase
MVMTTRTAGRYGLFKPLLSLSLVISALALAGCGGGSSIGGDGATTSGINTPGTGDAAAMAVSAVTPAGSGPQAPSAFANPAGTVLTVSTGGGIDHGNAFFKPLGNGRSCASCHQEGQAWSVTPAALQARFNASGGTDPVFQLVDGADSPNQRVATLDQKRTAYSLLLNKGLIRVGQPMPVLADFQLLSVDDPYGYANAQELSLYRRPLPSTNLKFLGAVMWDGRETLADANATACILNSNPAQCFASITTDLLDQANGAVKSHAQLAAGLTPAQQQSIVNFESSLFTAQATDRVAGSLSAAGAQGGPAALAAVNYYFGINDPAAGDYRTQAPFTRNVMTVFSAWAGAAAPGGMPPTASAQAQAAIARGQAIFNTRPFTIAGVNGLNDTLRQPAIRGSCSSCHSAPNVGSLAVPRLFDTGVSAAVLRSPDLPLYTFRNPQTGATRQSTDPGAALQTGKWEDIGKFKTPGLRALAARPPYFHNGSAPDLRAVVGFYDRRFRLGLTPPEAADLVAFLQAL